MLTITRDQLQGRSDNTDTVAFEASELGLAPGEWPDFIAVISPRTNSGWLFRRTDCEARSDDGEVLFYNYRDTKGLGFTVRIFND